MIRCFIFLACLLLGVSLPIVTVSAEEDPIHEKCTSQQDRPAPWCYQEEVEQIGDPDLCENILDYWPTANGVHGWCFYRLALKNKDCSLCNRIKKADIRKMCIRDVCKSKK